MRGCDLEQGKPGEIRRRKATGLTPARDTAAGPLHPHLDLACFGDTRMKTRILLTATIVLVLCGYSAAATMATFTAETKNPTNKFASGTLVLSNTKSGGSGACLSTGGATTDTNANTSCDTLFGLTVKKPGDSGSANLTLLNAGSLAASALKLYSSACTDADATGETYHGTGSMCSNVQLYIQQWTNSNFTGASSCVYGGGTATTCAYSAAKTMGDFATNYGSSGSALTIGSGLASGASAYFTIAVQLPSTAGNSLQGRSAAEDFTWHIDQ